MQWIGPFAMMTETLARYPHDVRAQLDLADSYKQLGDVQTCLGRLAPALRGGAERAIDKLHCH